MWLFIAFLAVPLIEITLFIQIGSLIGLGWTLLTVVATAILGTYLVRNQGLLAMSQIRDSFSEIRDPTEPLVHGAMILFSGALLLTPGFFTDAVGFLLLVPSVRTAAFRSLRSRMKVNQFSAPPGQARPQKQGGEVIDGDYADVTPETQENRGPSGWTNH